MSRLRLWACAALFIAPMAAHCAGAAALEVQEAFVELHTSPNSSYPVVDIAERGEKLQIIKRRTEWLKVRTEGGRVGWIHMLEVRKSLKAAGLSAMSLAKPKPPAPLSL